MARTGTGMSGALRQQRGQVLTNLQGKSGQGGGMLFPDAIVVSGRRTNAARAARQSAESPKQLVARSYDDNGNARGWYRIGDQLSEGDLISYAQHTPEYSESFSKSKTKRFGEIQEVGDFIWWVFNRSESFTKHRDEYAFDCPNSCHIASMKYADRWQMLMVTFRNNGTCIVYTRVPYMVFGKLKELAEDKTALQLSFVDNEYHTPVGIAFWDYVRIRGSRHGTQFPAYYVSGFPSGGSSGGGTGAKTMAEEGRARAGTGLVGENGLEAGRAAREESRAAAPEKAIAFLDDIYENDEHTAIRKEVIEGVRKAAGELANMEGTVAYALTHGSILERGDNAKDVAQLFIDYFLNGASTSKSTKGALRDMVTDPKNDEPWKPLIEMEKYMHRQNRWPLSL